MIHIADKKECCGCQACGDVCPQGAIDFRTDAEGFWYPEINVSKCVQCGLCEQVCPMLNLESIKHYRQHEPLVYGGYHKNVAVRFDSTSGGAFSALAGVMYREKGYVAGAIQNSDWTVTNFISNNKRDLARLRSSKYVQSSAEGLYKEIRRLLEAGEKALVCGSPCQMAALRSFLGKDFENLVIVDFICRATNSPKVYSKYLAWLESKYNSKIISVKAKNKDHGWRSLARKVVFEDGNVYYGESEVDPYRRGYHLNFYQRPSCYDCKFKGFPRCADITIGDFWGIENVDPSLDHNLGTSCILINTERGKEFFEKARANMEIKKFSLEQVLAGNREPLMIPVAFPNCDRKEFFADLDRISFDALVEKFFPLHKAFCPPPPKSSLLRKIRVTVGLLKRCILHPGLYAHCFYWSYFHKNIDANFLRGRFFNVYKYCSINLRPGSKIVIGHGEFRLGTKRNLRSKLETRLLLDEGATLRILGSGAIASGADIQIFKNAILTLGSGVALNSGLQLVCAESITIGNDVHIGRDVWIRDNNGEHYIIQPGYTWKGSVTIGSHCWICSNVSIMKGVTIGEGTVVSAHSVVTHSLPAHCIASGNPAEVIAENIVWLV